MVCILQLDLQNCFENKHLASVRSMSLQEALNYTFYQVFTTAKNFQENISQITL